MRPFNPSELTRNEIAWIEFLRLITNDAVPSPELYSVQAMRLALKARSSDDVEPFAEVARSRGHLVG